MGLKKLEKESGHLGLLIIVVYSILTKNQALFEVLCAAILFNCPIKQGGRYSN